MNKLRILVVFILLFALFFTNFVLYYFIIPKWAIRDSFNNYFPNPIAFMGTIHDIFVKPVATITDAFYLQIPDNLAFIFLILSVSPIILIYSVVINLFFQLLTKLIYKKAKQNRIKFS